MKSTGTFKGWIEGKSFGFISQDGIKPDIFVHASALKPGQTIKRGDRLNVEYDVGFRGLIATRVEAAHLPASDIPDKDSEAPDLGEIEPEEYFDGEYSEPDLALVSREALIEISTWKREAKSEDNERYFWSVDEVSELKGGQKCFVIGRKGAGKTALCEYFNRSDIPNTFSEKLSFKNFPFNELYLKPNKKYTQPNEYITLWKLLIYNTVCRLMLKNPDLDKTLRAQLEKLYGAEKSLSRRIAEWLDRDFTFALWGASLKIGSTKSTKEPSEWIESVNYLEDLLSTSSLNGNYLILFDELDEDYRDIFNDDQRNQYISLINSLFKAVQDVRATIPSKPEFSVNPIVFLRDDIYEIIRDNDKTKWGDFRINLNWDVAKIRNVLAFRISRAIDAECAVPLKFDDAWSRVFGVDTVRGAKSKRVESFEYITRSTLLRPRDYVAYLQNCAEYALNHNEGRIDGQVVKAVDKAFSNYLRSEFTDELFAILPDIAEILDTISQLRKWNFSIDEFKILFEKKVEGAIIKEKNFEFVLQILFIFSVIGNQPRTGYYVFRYQNPEARLNFNERIIVHRGLFKSLQIL